MKRSFYLLAVCALVAILPAAAFGTASYTLTDGNASVKISPMAITGMDSWTIDGPVDHLDTQWFWYRYGGMTRELSLENLDAAPTIVATANSLTATYADNAVSITVAYELSYDGPGASTVKEDITIVNNTAGLLDLSFFQYSDFDLGGTAAGDEGNLVPSSPEFLRAQQWEDVTVGLVELFVDRELTTVTPANHGAIVLGDSLFNLLEDNNVDTLSDVAGPVGEGDVAFAFQWDYTLGAGAAALISKSKTLAVTTVPEPGVAGLLLVGLGLLAVRRKHVR